MFKNNAVALQICQGQPRVIIYANFKTNFDGRRMDDEQRRLLS